MQIKIIPTLNVKTREEFITNLRAVENLTDIVQIDIADGKFANWKNWYDPEIIEQIDTPLNYELHVMSNNPEEEIEKWKNIKKIKRIILHVELKCGDKRCGLEKTANNIRNIFAEEIEIGFAINPETGIGFIQEIEPKPAYISGYSIEILKNIPKPSVPLSVESYSIEIIKALPKDTKPLYTSSYSVEILAPFAPLAEHTHYLGGTVLENTTPVERIVVAYDQTSFIKLAQTTSEGGGFVLPITTSGTCFVVCYDDDGGLDYNNLVAATVIPLPL